MYTVIKTFVLLACLLSGFSGCSNNRGDENNAAFSVRFDIAYLEYTEEDKWAEYAAAGAWFSLKEEEIFKQNGLFVVIKPKGIARDLSGGLTFRELRKTAPDAPPLTPGTRQNLLFEMSRMEGRLVKNISGANLTFETIAGRSQLMVHENAQDAENRIFANGKFGFRVDVITKGQNLYAVFMPIMFENISKQRKRHDFNDLTFFLRIDEEPHIFFGGRAEAANRLGSMAINNGKPAVLRITPVILKRPQI